MSLTRHFVTLSDRGRERQVHYRRQGDGPALLLLHQSPQSSREFEPLMAQWSENFTVIAPDTPGYGLSDPLQKTDATMEDLADGVMEFADAIGLSRFGVYGYHTGGGMAVALAHAFPDRVSAAAANGLVMPTAEELEAILTNYLPRFEPHWDGSHLAWLWARLREQTIFFPWHDRRLSTRMNFSVPPADSLQRNVREFLLAADHYHVAYGAAFAYPAGPVLPQLQVPTLVTAAALDPLASHLDRIGDRADCVKIEVSANAQAAIDNAFAHVLGYPGDPAPAAPPTAATRERPWQDVVHVDNRPVRLVRRGPAIDILAIHDAGGSASTIAAPLAKLAGVAAMDLPGHGERAPYLPDESEPASMADCATAVTAAAAALNICPVLAGHGAGALVALAAAAQAPERFRGLLLTDLPVLNADLAADWREQGLRSLAADWHGGHLSRAWHMVRDGRLFYPWFRREQSSVRWIEPDLAPRRLQLEVRELLVAEGVWQALRAEQLAADPLAMLATCGLPVILATDPLHPLHESTSLAAQKAPEGSVLCLAGTADEQAAALRGAVAPLLAS